MTTNTFERKIQISDTEALKRLVDIMTSPTPEKSLSEHPYTAVDRERGEQLLKQCLSRSISECNFTNHIKFPC